jgi:hypothetical protein
VRRVLIAVLACNFMLLGQNVSRGSFQGTVTDDKGKGIAGALVTAVRQMVINAGVPSLPYSQTTVSDKNGTFVLSGLLAGTYSYCAQVPGGSYIDACLWGTARPEIAISAAQSSAGNTIRMARGSILKVRLDDPNHLSNAKFKDGKTPPVLMGVWDGRGHFIPVRNTGKDNSGFDYQVTIPFDTALNFHISSQALKLSDSAGTAVAAAGSQSPVQHNSTDAAPKGLRFTVVGVNP